MDYEKDGTQLNWYASENHDYDFESVMHYPNDMQFPVLQPKTNPDAVNRLGLYFIETKSPMSPNDRKKMINAYCRPKSSKLPLSEVLWHLN